MALSRLAKLLFAILLVFVLTKTTWADEPSVTASEWSYSIRAGSKPYMFTFENVYDEICPEIDGVRLFSEFLKANPQSKGNIIIRDTSSKRMRRKQEQVVSELTKKYRVPLRQLRIYLRIEPTTGMKPPVEYWFVP